MQLFVCSRAGAEYDCQTARNFFADGSYFVVVRRPRIVWRFPLKSRVRMTCMGVDNLSFVSSVIVGKFDLAAAMPGIPTRG